MAQDTCNDDAPRQTIPDLYDNTAQAATSIL